MDKAIKYSELVINEDVKKWYIGKIYSDALVIYIGTSMMKGSLRPTQLLTCFKQYHEVAYPILAFSKPQIDYINKKSIDEFIKAINVKSLILNFHQFSIKIDKQDYLQQLNTNLSPQNFGEIEFVDIDLPFKDDEELFVI